MNLYLCDYVYVYHCVNVRVCVCIQFLHKPEEGVRFPGFGVSSCEPSDMGVRNQI